ncbi:hypothetical protein R1sor_008275 [Riccia sorocarpa]|uniref:Amino acid transporter transmembrane domain-containing protein n=1 Tax=Riccia sorocarpa TaxID=122646 RepID=A0ABD3HZ52_9MARC
MGRDEGMPEDTNSGRMWSSFRFIGPEDAGSGDEVSVPINLARENRAVRRSTSADLERFNISPSMNRRANLWPRTFEQQMSRISRSASLEEVGTPRSDSLNEPLLRSTSGLEQKPSLRNRVPTFKQTVENGRPPKSRVPEVYEKVSLESDALTPAGDDTRKTEGRESSFLQACFNGMNILAGVGILSTPYALSQGGWLSLGILLLFGVICLYTGILLRKCMEADESIASYLDIGQAAFGPNGRFLIAIVIYVELFCATVEYLIMEGDNLASIFALPDFQIGSFTVTAHQVFVVLSALLFMPTVWLRELSLLSYLSAGGILACVAIVFVVGYVGAFRGIGFNHTGTFVHLSGLPMAVGISAFCYTGHAVFPSIYNDMKDKSQFSKVLTLCFISITILYGVTAVEGYTMFGEDVKSQVTLNLPTSLVSSRVAVWIIVIIPFAKYALTITPVAQSLEEFLPWDSESKEFRRGSICIRSLLVLSTVVVALTVPFFGLMMAFIGSSLSIMGAVILPCLCYSRIHKEISCAERSVLVIVIVIGIAAGIIGTYTSILGIVRKSEGY